MSRFFSFLFLSLFLGLSGVTGIAFANKPISPLSVVMESTTQAVAGERLDLNVTISSRVELEHVEIQLNMPVGVSLLSGKQSASIHIQPGQYQELNFRLMLPEVLSGRIEVTAKVKHGKAITYSSRDSIALGQSARRARSLGSSPSYEIKERNGRRLREYTLPK